MENKIRGLRRTCPRCGTDFAICAACDRLHWYCSPGCSQESRKETLRRAARAYRATEKGRENSRKCQRTYRRRKHQTKKSVSHHSSPPPISPLDKPLQLTFEEDSNALSAPVKAGYTVAVCIVCKRPIHFFLQISDVECRRMRQGRLNRCYLRKPRPK